MLSKSITKSLSLKRQLENTNVSHTWGTFMYRYAFKQIVALRNIIWWSCLKNKHRLLQIPCTYILRYRVMKAWNAFGFYSSAKKKAIQKGIDNLCTRAIHAWQTYAHTRNLLMRGLGIHKVGTTTLLWRLRYHLSITIISVSMPWKI